MRRKRATEFVTSDEMTLREFYDANAMLIFRTEHQYFFGIFNQITLKIFFEYVIITWDFGHHP